MKNKTSCLPNFFLLKLVCVERLVTKEEYSNKIVFFLSFDFDKTNHLFFSSLLLLCFAVVARLEIWVDNTAGGL